MAAFLLKMRVTLFPSLLVGVLSTSIAQALVLGRPGLLQSKRATSFENEPTYYINPEDFLDTATAEARLKQGMADMWEIAVVACHCFDQGEAIYARYFEWDKHHDKLVHCK